MACSMPAPGPRALGVKGARQTLMGLVLAVAVMAPGWTLSAAGPLPVDLLSTAHFAVLAGAGITVAGPVKSTTITGMWGRFQPCRSRVLATLS